MIDDQILRKIKRCMDLSDSSNEHEAAMAIKQMQSLMRKHGITESHILASEITSESCILNVKKNIPRWVVILHQAIGNALDCESMVTFVKGSQAKIIFIGVNPSVEIANYAFEVLYRKLLESRKNYIATKLTRFKKTNKTKMADAYCEGWVISVYQKIKNLSPNLEIKSKINAYVGKVLNLNETHTYKAKDNKFKENDRAYKAMQDGFNESKDVNLHIATGTKEKTLIGTGA